MKKGTPANRQSYAAQETFDHLRSKVFEHLQIEASALKFKTFAPPSSSVPTKSQSALEERRNEIVLYFTEGTSDKTYQIWYKKAVSKRNPKSSEFTVYTAHGRRNGTLRQNAVVTYQSEGLAIGRVSAIAKVKISEGYTKNWDGKPWT